MVRSVKVWVTLLVGLGWVNSTVPRDWGQTVWCSHFVRIAYRA